MSENPTLLTSLDLRNAREWIEKGTTLHDGERCMTGWARLIERLLVAVTAHSTHAAAMKEARAKAAYQVCAETRHASLGDAVAAAIRAQPDPAPSPAVADGYLVAGSASDGLLPVIQRDREFAADWYRKGTWARKRILAGKRDHIPVVQAAASHRLGIAIPTPAAPIESELYDAV